MPDRTELRNLFDQSHADENTYFKIFSHVLQRGWHIGSVVGTALVVPTLLARDEGNKTFMQHIDAAGKAGVGVGGVYGLLGAISILQESRPDTEQRVHQLYYNDSQTRADRFGQVGAAVGVATALVTEKRDVWNVLGHAAAGTAVALIAHTLTNPGRSHWEQAKDHLSKSADHAGDSLRNQFDRANDRR